MGKLDTIKTICDIAKIVHEAAVATSDLRARREKERREAENAEKDRRIKELEAKLAEKGTA